MTTKEDGLAARAVAVGLRAVTPNPALRLAKRRARARVAARARTAALRGLGMVLTPYGWE